MVPTSLIRALDLSMNISVMLPKALDIMPVSDIRKMTRPIRATTATTVTRTPPYSLKILDLAKQIIKFSGLEPYKDIDIKIVGARKGERLYEPLWLDEENPTATEYAKILQLKNLPYESTRLNSLIEKLKPICFYDNSAPELFRNKEELLKLLCDDVPTLKEFYESLKTEEQLRTDIL